MTSLKGDLRSIMGTPFGGVGHAVLIFSRVTRAAFDSDSVILQLHDRIEMPEEAGGKFQVDGLDPGPIRIELEGGAVHNHGWNIDLPDEGTWSLADLVDAQVDWSPAVIGRAEAAARDSRDHADRAEAAADRVGTAEQVGTWASEASASASAAASAESGSISARNASQSARDAAEGHADRAATSESNAAASESAAKQSETNAGDYAAVATTAATESVAAMERATEIAGGDFATHEYVDQKVASVTLTGTGSPEGKVTASVGTTYTDTAATNGAIRWTKTSGTGSSGWVVEYGDTGWRDVTALIPRAVLEGQMLIRRTTTMASIYFYNLLLEDSGLSYQDFGNFLSSGFYDPSIQYFYVGGLANRGANYAAGAVRISRFGGLRIQDVRPGQYMTGMVSLTTGKAWPSTLPGVPA